MEIKLYSAEADLKEIIQNSAIALYCKPESYTPSEEDMSRLQEAVAKTSDLNIKRAFEAFSEKTRQPDLHYIKTVMVTANVAEGNLNGDWFLPANTWDARYTPIDKYLNNGHDHKEIIGHITNAYAAIDDDLDVEIDQMTDKFHIVTTAVIYKYYREADLKERNAKLIEDVIAGKKYVSMEALFSDFDYMLEQTDGSFKVEPRNEDTAYLTKHLRCYGGKGEYGGKKVQRAIKNMVFSGKGLVDVPANPESVILETASQKTIFIPTVWTANSNNSVIRSTNSENVVYSINDAWKNNPQNIIWDGTVWTTQTTSSSKRENKMETIEILQKELAAARAEIKDLNEKANASNVEGHKSQIAALEGKVSGLEKSLADANEKVTKLAADVEASKAETKAAKDEVEAEKKEKDAMKKSCAALEEEVAAFKSKEVTAVRVNKLIDAGKTRDEAEALAAKLAKADEDTFAAFVETFAAFPPKDSKKDEKKGGECKADLTVLDEVKEESTADLNVATAAAAATEKKEVQEAFASLVSSYLKKNR